MFALILQVVLAALKFPNAFRAMLNYLEDTPEEKDQEIAGKVSAWMKDSAESERPIWDGPK